jgi:tetratricopeptide (TPR) repeat protein
MTIQDPAMAKLWHDVQFHRKQSDWVAMREACVALLRHDAAHVPALLRLSEAHEAIGDYRSSLSAVLAAHSLKPAQPELLFALAQRLRHFNEIEAVVECARHPAFVAANQPGMQAELGVALSLEGQLDVARVLIDRAIESVGEDAPLVYSRGRIHEFAGNFAEAESDFRKTLAQAPADPFAHWSLSRLPDVARRGEDIDRLNNALERVASGSRAEAVLRFALFNRLDALGEVDRAWPHLEAANRSVRSGLHIPTADVDAAFDALLQRGQGWALPADSGIDQDGPAPIFIVGLHRSGSTLLETLLSRHPKIATGGELHDFPAQLRWATNGYFDGPSARRDPDGSAGIDYRRLGHRYLRHVRWRAKGRDFLTDKLPMNFLNIGLILRAIPHAKIVHTARDPMGTCFSNYKEIFSGVAHYSYDQREMADYYVRYRRLMAHWHQVLPGQILDVSYSDLVKAPADVVSRVLTFCGVGAAEHEYLGAPQPVTTASSPQIRGAVHQRGLFAWESYRPKLGPLLERLDAQGIDILG